MGRNTLRSHAQSNGQPGKRVPHRPARAKACGGRTSDTVIEKKRKSVFGLGPDSGTELPKPLEFPVRTLRNTSFVMLMR